MTRDDIQKTDQEDKNQVTRNPRDEDRTSKLQVKLPDGRILTRRPTEDLGQQGYKLSAPKKKGYYRRWISDETDHRVQYYIDLGFIPATDSNGTSIKQRRGGTRKEGGSYDMYLMEIPLKALERLKKRHAELDTSAKAQKNQEKWLSGQHVEGFTHNIESDGRSYNKVTEVDIKSPSK